MSICTPVMRQKNYQLILLERCFVAIEDEYYNDKTISTDLSHNRLFAGNQLQSVKVSWTLKRYDNSIPSKCQHITAPALRWVHAIVIVQCSRTSAQLNLMKNHCPAHWWRSIPIFAKNQVDNICFVREITEYVKDGTNWSITKQLELLKCYCLIYLQF